MASVCSVQRWPKRESEQERTDLSLYSSKIFPPTQEDLPANENPAESETTEDAPAVSKDTSSSEPQSKKLKTSTTEDLGNEDWEAVEKPTSDEAAAAADMSEEGEKVEAVELGGSDGEKIEKPAVVGEQKGGAVQPENMLAKDWWRGLMVRIYGYGDSPRTRGLDNSLLILRVWLRILRADSVVSITSWKMES